MTRAEAISSAIRNRPAMEQEPDAGSRQSNTASGSLAVTKWEPVFKSSLRGFCSVTSSRSGATMHHVAINVTSGRPWASPPARATPLRDERGKTIWEPLFTFGSRELRDQWSEQVIRALLVAFPHALDEPTT